MIGDSRLPERLEYEPGQVILEQGARSDLVHPIEDGGIHDRPAAVDGTEEALAMLRHGRPAQLWTPVHPSLRHVGTCTAW
jgi:hypothetical protein